MHGLCLVAIHQHCLLPPSSYFCFLKNVAFIKFSFDEALFLAVVFILSLSSLPFKCIKTPLRERKLQLDENGGDHCFGQRHEEDRGEETQEQRESGTETIKVPLGIMQVPDIRYVSKEI